MCFNCWGKQTPYSRNNLGIATSCESNLFPNLLCPEDSMGSDVFRGWKTNETRRNSSFSNGYAAKPLGLCLPTLLQGGPLPFINGGYNPYKWPYKLVAAVKNPTSWGHFTPFITGDGAHLIYMKTKIPGSTQ